MVKQVEMMEFGLCILDRYEKNERELAYCSKTKIFSHKEKWKEFVMLRKRRYSTWNIVKIIIMLKIKRFSFYWKFSLFFPDVCDYYQAISFILFNKSTSNYYSIGILSNRFSTQCDVIHIVWWRWHMRTKREVENWKIRSR